MKCRRYFHCGDERPSVCCGGGLCGLRAGSLTGKLNIRIKESEVR